MLINKSHIDKKGIWTQISFFLFIGYIEDFYLIFILLYLYFLGFNLFSQNYARINSKLINICWIKYF